MRDVWNNFGNNNGKTWEDQKARAKCRSKIKYVAIYTIQFCLPSQDSEVHDKLLSLLQILQELKKKSI